MRRTVMVWGVLALVAALGSCVEQTGDGREHPEEAGAAIDQRSYRLGSIGAFAEMVGAGVKALALSAPMDPEEMDALLSDARRIASQHQVETFLETDFLVTDLFPAGLTEGKQVLLICRENTYRAYLELKARKSELLENGAYEGEAREEIARGMGALLSYSEEKVNALLIGAG